MLAAWTVVVAGALTVALAPAFALQAPPPPPPPPLPTVTLPPAPAPVPVPVPVPVPPAPVPPTPTLPAPPAPVPPAPPAPTPAPPASPSLPAPPVAAPSPAAPQAPGAAPRQAAGSTPPAPTPQSAPANAPAAASSGGGAPAGQPSWGSSFPSSTAPARGAREGTPRLTREARPEAKKARTRAGATIVRLEFALPSAQRLFLIVRAAAPSCRVVGVVSLRGRAGFNSVPFGGSLRGERLAPGVYGLTIARTRTAPSAPAVYVRVVSPRRTVPVAPPRAGACDAAPAAAGDPRMIRLLGPVGHGSVVVGTAARPAAVAGRAAPSAPLLPPPVPDVDGDVVLADLPESPPALGADEGRGMLEALASVAALTAVGLLLVMMLALVTRFLRGSWNP